jgi:hypothetical protein
LTDTTYNARFLVGAGLAPPGVSTPASVIARKQHTVMSKQHALIPTNTLMSKQHAVMSKQPTVIPSETGGFFFRVQFL